MDDTLLTETAKALGALLEAHRGGDVVVLDLRGLNAWTDFFVITTVTSSTHSQGLERHIKDFCNERNIEILRFSARPRSGRSEGKMVSQAAIDEEWRLIDMGAIVIHLMTAKTRSFYELERLWGAGETIYSSSSNSSSSSSS
jgi:ribosome-associated protein